jgi:hypothetical protein
MQQLDWAFLQLTLVGSAFAALQVWWIGRILRRRDLAKPLDAENFRKCLERIWKKEQQRR